MIWIAQVCSQESNCQWVKFGLGYGSMLNKQAIIRNNDTNSPRLLRVPTPHYTYDTFYFTLGTN